MKKRVGLCLLGGSAFVGLLLTTWHVDAQQATQAGAPLPGLTTAQMNDFNDGVDEFTKVEMPADGLGPVFNGQSCAECHAQGGLGGSAPNLTVARVTRIGGMRNEAYDDLADYGGPVIEARSIKEFFPNCPILPEVVPVWAPVDKLYVSHRITTPLFGAGLIENIREEDILANVFRLDFWIDGVHGVPNVVKNIETGYYEIGKFGWKAGISSLHVFAGDAYLNEMGITNPYFPHNNLPQGQPIPAEWDLKPGIEDASVEAFVNFMRLLGAPPRGTITNDVNKGDRVFDRIGCDNCHIPTMRTKRSDIAALSNKTVPLYSDLLLHRMGGTLADGIQQGTSTGDQFRTAPLWGLGLRKFFLHDGRAATIEEAIVAHGGEATNARNRYLNLNNNDRANLLAFLRSL